MDQILNSNIFDLIKSIKSEIIVNLQ